ncbi:MAG: hypothetical protein D4R67_12590 [Bacteroidetes bacterium]|nr:MAG: hypothetical protein D4R67_12590 [Bacteroidota bacterium]
MKLEPGTKFTQSEIADAWAKITIRRWRKKIRTLKIGETNSLYDSFVRDVIGSANGDLIKIDFAFKYYGKFVDMGVGKGTKISGVKESKTSRRLEGRMLGNRRRAKKWYSKTFHAETMRLREILVEHYAEMGSLTIIENIDDNSKSK